MQTVALLAAKIDGSFPLTRSFQKFPLCCWVSGTQKQTQSPPSGNPQGDKKHHDIRKFGVTGNMGRRVST